MKLTLTVALLLMLMLTACQAIPAATPVPSPATPALAPEIEQRATAWLAGEAKVAEADLSLVKAERVVWTDSCFGLGGPAESCLRADIPGWRIAFEAAGKQYEVRTDEAGESFRLAP